jgi:glyoxylase-like metal-dependent hydrolase (beta-lactamase superfamily II)
MMDTMSDNRRDVHQREAARAPGPGGRARRVRRVLLATGGVLLLLAAILPAGVLVVTFGGLVPAEDGTELPGGARLVRDGFVNLYVLPAGPGAVALIDCGADLEGAAIKAELARRGLGPDAVKAIFITHGHGDHIGACRLFPQARVYAFSEEVGLVGGVEAAKGPVPRLRGALRERATRVSHTLADGETVHVGPLSVQSFHIPGHTGGSAAYLASGVLYLGDSAAIEREGRLRKAAWIFSDDQEESFGAVRGLARRLEPRRQELRALACGHSGPWTDASPLLELGH